MELLSLKFVVVNPDPKVILITVDACFVFIIDKVADKLELFGLILSIILFFNIFFRCEFFSKRAIIWLFWIDMFYVYQRCLECVSIYLMTARVHHHHFNWSLIGGNKNSISDMEPKYRHVYWSEATFANKIRCGCGQLRHFIIRNRESINRR